MKLKKLKEKKFEGKTKLLAEEMRVNQSQIRNWIADDREVKLLADGRYILVNSHNKYIKVD